jgi:hypothetical protein
VKNENENEKNENGNGNENGNEHMRSSKMTKSDKELERDGLPK